MIDDLYSDRILELAGSIGRLGRLPAPDASARAHAPTCGSTITVDLVLRDGGVTDFAQEVRACALGQAAASVLASAIIGATPDEIRAARAAAEAMLKAEGAPPDGRFAEMRWLAPVRHHPSRHASTLLAFDAAVDCLDRIEHGRAGAAA